MNPEVVYNNNVYDASHIVDCIVYFPNAAISMYVFGTNELYSILSTFIQESRDALKTWYSV